MAIEFLKYFGLLLGVYGALFAGGFAFVKLAESLEPRVGFPASFAVFVVALCAVAAAILTALTS